VVIAQEVATTRVIMAPATASITSAADI